MYYENALKLLNMDARVASGTPPGAAPGTEPLKTGSVGDPRQGDAWTPGRATRNDLPKEILRQEAFGTARLGSYPMREIARAWARW